MHGTFGFIFLFNLSMVGSATAGVCYGAHQGPALLRQIYDKIYDNYHGFSNKASNRLAAVLAANQKSGLKTDDKDHRFYHGISLITQIPYCNGGRRYFFQTYDTLCSQLHSILFQLCVLCRLLGVFQLGL